LKPNEQVRLRGVIELHYYCARFLVMLAAPFIILLSFYNPPYQAEIKTYLSFSIENKDAVWSQIYHEDDMPAAELYAKVFAHLKRNPWLVNLKYEGEDLVADINRLKLEYKRYGGKFMKTSNILRTGRWYGKLRISFKDDKYRVIVYGLHYVAWQPTSGSGKATIEGHEVNGTFSEWVLNDFHTGFRKSRFSNLDIVHLNFKERFTLHENQLIDSDW
jgi:hypothetical protein